MSQLRLNDLRAAFLPHESILLEKKGVTLRCEGILNPSLESWIPPGACLVMIILGPKLVWKNDSIATAASHSVLSARHGFLDLISTVRNSVAVLNARSYLIGLHPQVDAKDDASELL